jgi:hypothetical protein
MDHLDTDRFDMAFSRLSAVLRPSMKGVEVKQLATAYFRALEDLPIEAVLAAAKVCLRTFEHFPKPVDWRQVVEAAQRTATAKALVPHVDHRQMTQREVDEHERAHGLRFEDANCCCADCEAAGVTHRPLRFVPIEWADGTLEHAINPRTNKLEIVGEWAHGMKLRRWYEARDAFFALAKKHPHAAHVLAFAQAREPGEEG